MTLSSKNIYFALLHLVAFVLAVEVFVLSSQNTALKNPRNRESSSGVRIGDSLIIANISSIEGAEVKTVEKGLVYLFTTTCPFCEENMSTWKELSQIAATHNINTIGISLDNAERTKEFVRNHEVTFRVLVSDGNRFRELNHIVGVPTTLRISANGVVSGVWTGALGEKDKAEVVAQMSKRGHTVFVLEAELPHKAETNLNRRYL